MNKAISSIIAGILLAVSSLPRVGATDVTDGASSYLVAKFAVVTMSDGSGRAQRFRDFRNREFAVTYNSQRRVQSVLATRGPHISDVVWIGYEPTGKLAGVRFRTGYVVLFKIGANGVQTIRDSQGVTLTRSGAAIQSLDTTATESSAKLAAAVTEIESLLSALGQSTR